MMASEQEFHYSAMGRLEFRYSALGLFREPKGGLTELRVILLRSTNWTEAIEEAEARFQKYAADFNLEDAGGWNVYEYGNDMFEDHCEVFSATWSTDNKFEQRLEEKIFERRKSS